MSSLNESANNIINSEWASGNILSSYLGIPSFTGSQSSGVSYWPDRSATQQSDASYTLTYDPAYNDIYTERLATRHYSFSFYAGGRIGGHNYKGITGFQQNGAPSKQYVLDRSFWRVRAWVYFEELNGFDVLSNWNISWNQSYTGGTMPGDDQRYASTATTSWGLLGLNNSYIVPLNQLSTITIKVDWSPNFASGSDSSKIRMGIFAQHQIEIWPWRFRIPVTNAGLNASVIENHKHSYDFLRYGDGLLIDQFKT